MAAGRATLGPWLKFLLVPLVVSIVLETLIAALVGGVWRHTRNDLTSRVALFFAYAVVGRVMGARAPQGRNAWAVIYAVFFASADTYLGYASEGNAVQILGQAAVQHLSMATQLVQLAGMLAGIASVSKVTTRELERR